MNNKKTISLVLCSLIFLLAVVGSIFCFAEITFVETKIIAHGIEFFKFFTVQSNVLAGITALIYIIFLVREQKTQKKIPIWVFILRFIATIDLIITFLVVALFLGFITDEGYLSMFVNANFLFHLAIPIINFASFVFYENPPKFKFSYTFWGITHLILYGIFYIIVVLLHYQNGTVPLEYDWYAFAQKGLVIAFVCATVVWGLGYLVSFMLYKINNRKKQD